MLAALVLLAVVCGCSKTSSPVNEEPIVFREPYPWTTSTPSAQGLDSILIDQAVAAVRGQPYMFSLLIVRNDFLVLEHYNASLTRYNDYEVRSVSKAVTSALVGIAVQKGFIDSVGQPMMDFFTDLATPQLDPRAYDITIEHLLTMRAGFDFDESADPSGRFNNNTDWLKEAIHLPFKTNPGDAFSYATPIVNILSGILTRSSGMTTREFADQNLFEPLGIAVRRWDRDPQGIYLGGTGMVFTARDLARIGYLYLKNGRVGGNMILQPGWIQASQIPRNQSNGTYAALQSVNYGYQWWTSNDTTASMYFAAGFGGQFIFVIPSADMVVVFTATAQVSIPEARQHEGFVISLLVQSILPAVN